MNSLCLILYLITKLNLKYKKLSLEVSDIRIYGSRYKFKYYMWNN